MARARDDFNKGTKRTLQERVGSRCSNPDCRCLTSGPNFKDEKVTRIGVAAHITAAAEGGPRFKPSLSKEARVHISNGIWLCQNCSNLVDNDEQTYTIPLLLKWKSLTEEICRDELEGKSPVNYQENIGWNCTHCFSHVEHLQTVCRGCFAEIVYSGTRDEIKLAGITGFCLGGGFGKLVFSELPAILNSNFGLSVPFRFGLGFFPSLSIGTVLAIVCMLIGIFLTEREHFGKPPRFFRQKNI